MQMMTRTSVAAMLGLMLAACGAGGGRQPSQVVARVNGSEITASQLNAELLAQNTGPSPENNAAAAAAQASRPVIDGLIDEQLLYVQAEKLELDRDPAVVQELERARRQVLARAYAQRMIFPNEPVSAAAQIDYYRKHPELFEKRRVYQLTEFRVRTSDLSDTVRSQLDRAATPEALRSVLAEHRIGFESQSFTRAAEQLPLDALPDFGAAQIGDLLVMPARDGRTAMLLVTGAQDSPIDLEHAQPIIQQYLVNTRNEQALTQRLKQMRATAQITYGNPVLSRQTALN